MQKIGTPWRIALSIAVFLLALAPRPSHAYDPDTHYQVTYALCRAVGVSPTWSLWSEAPLQVEVQCEDGYREAISGEGLYRARKARQ